MRVLHTSDLHLGRLLYGRKRYDEFESYLDWLLATVESERVDVLLLAGDIFDTTTPTNRAQDLYFSFLARVVQSPCRHVVIIAGNHDSASLLNAPRQVLRALDVHVVSNPSEDPSDEVVQLHGPDGEVELIVCAIPYLRDRDVRVVAAGESADDKEANLKSGIAAHHLAVAEAARAQRDALGDQGADVPIVAMSHLFTAGGQVLDGDGVRDLYVGSLAHVSGAIFPDYLDYVALGHLHVPQRVGDSDVRRYSGSPLPMGFGEATQTKSVCLVEFDGRKPTVRLLEIPVFQRLARIAGDWDTISERVTGFAESSQSVWLEVIYTGEEVIGDLNERLAQAVDGSAVEILRVKNARVVQRAMAAAEVGESLTDLDPTSVFDRLLTAHDVPEAQRDGLVLTYQEAIQALRLDGLAVEE